MTRVIPLALLFSCFVYGQSADIARLREEIQSEQQRLQQPLDRLNALEKQQAALPPATATATPAQPKPAAPAAPAAASDERASTSTHVQMSARRSCTGIDFDFSGGSHHVKLRHAYLKVDNSKWANCSRENIGRISWTQKRCPKP